MRTLKQRSLPTGGREDGSFCCGITSLIKCATMVVVCFFLVSSIAMASSNSDRNLMKLPKTAQKMIRSNFSKYTVKKVSTKGGNYEVLLSSNIELTFNHDGQWMKVDCKNGTVPSGIVSTKIRDYVKKNYKNAKIRRIERVGRDYKVSLSTGKALTFDHNYNVVRGGSGSKNNTQPRKLSPTTNNKNAPNGAKRPK